jgi:hypothetical protein
VVAGAAAAQAQQGSQLVQSLTCLARHAGGACGVVPWRARGHAGAASACVGAGVWPDSLPNDIRGLGHAAPCLFWGGRGGAGTGQGGSQGHAQQPQRGREHACDPPGLLLHCCWLQIAAVCRKSKLAQYNRAVWQASLLLGAALLLAAGPHFFCIRCLSHPCCPEAPVLPRSLLPAAETQSTKQVRHARSSSWLFVSIIGVKLKRIPLPTCHHSRSVFERRRQAR